MRLVQDVRDVIRGWARAGEVMFDMESLLEEYAGVESIEVEGGPKIVLPTDRFYVHFGSKAELFLEDGDAFIDGMYVQETILALPRILINGGRRGYLVGIPPSVLTDKLRATPVQCAN